MRQWLYPLFKILPITGFCPKIYQDSKIFRCSVLLMLGPLEPELFPRDQSTPSVLLEGASMKMVTQWQFLAP